MADADHAPWDTPADTDDVGHGEGMHRPGRPTEDGTGPTRPLLRLVVASATLGLAIALLGAGWGWVGLPADQVRVVPGPTTDLRGDLTAAATDPGFAERDTAWLVTTVTTEQLSRLGWLGARLTGDADLEPVDRARQADIRVGAQLAMAHTRRLAPALAASLVHDSPLPPSDGLQVVAVEPGSPAADAGLVTGDVIFTLDGHAATTERLAELAEHPRPVELGVAPNGLGEPTTVVLAPTAEPGLRVLPRLPAGPLEGSLSEVTGGSAGLILTLAVLDAASPGDLTGGVTVAGTGAIDATGDVLAVVGVTQKARAAATDGAEVFLHPADAPPAGVPAGVQAVPVADVGQALDWLCDAGADDAICTGR